MKKKVICISDHETKVLFNLLGVDALVVDQNDDKTFIEYINKILANEEYGLVIINERMFIRNKQYILKIKTERRFPVIIEIPDLFTSTKKEYMVEMLNEIIGAEGR
jgi:vacuolar-type H+-ATPase subunit F/Vma7